LIKIWCPSCEEDKFEVKEVRAEEPFIVTEYKIDKNENYKTCAECGGNLERK